MPGKPSTKPAPAATRRMQLRKNQKKINLMAAGLEKLTYKVWDVKEKKARVRTIEDLEPAELAAFNELRVFYQQLRTYP